jgi:hypothetical protein
MEAFDSIELASGTAQPVWVAGHVYADAAPGTYPVNLFVKSDGGETVLLRLFLHVLELKLPDPQDYQFFLDLWQHPAAVARVHDLELWSEPHWSKLEESLSLLAGAGQKVVTATIIHDPWGSQTFDPHVSMVRWIRDPEGNLRFDFSVFDRYVELCERVGIRERIHCYSTSLGPGGRKDCKFRIENEVDGSAEDVVTEVGDETYCHLWGQFFSAFVPHLKERGWLERTSMAMDEKPGEVMQPMLTMIQEEAPDLGIALAGTYQSEIDSRVREYCVFYPGMSAEVMDLRRSRGLLSTFYVCCSPPAPNTFTHSPPVEARQMGWHAAATGADGFLRWAFESFNADPLAETAFGSWPPGDCFFVYPGPRSSIRFELLRKGIEDYECIEIARRRLKPGTPQRVRLEALVREAAAHRENPGEAARCIGEGRAYIDSVLSEEPPRRP